MTHAEMGERERECFYPLVDSPNISSSQSDQAKPGVWQFIQTCHLPCVWQVPRPLSTHLLLPVYNSRKLDGE